MPPAPSAPPPRAATAPPTKGESALKKVFILLRGQTGHDLSSPHRRRPDQAQNRELLRELPAEAGFQVRVAENSAEVEATRRIRPEPSANVNREALAALPASFRADLAQALGSLDAPRIARAIRRVAESVPSWLACWSIMRASFNTPAFCVPCRPATTVC